MDIMRFEALLPQIDFSEARIITGIKSKMWIERHGRAGEFSFTANLENNLLEELPIGSLISHTKTGEVMIVENHEIVEKEGHPTEVKISGRGFITIFENRIIGSNKFFPSNTGYTDYVLSADQIPTQARNLVRDHIDASYLIYNDDFAYDNISFAIFGGGDASVSRTIDRVTLYQALVDLLKIENVGVNTARPNTLYHPFNTDTLNIGFYPSNDRSAYIIYSQQTGELELADILKSSRTLKNAVIISGKWVEIFYNPTNAEGADLRVMFVKETRFDEHFATAPTGGDLSIVQFAMITKAAEFLIGQKGINLTKVNLSKKDIGPKYRRDFHMGDILTIQSRYGVSEKKRLVEFIESHDENGYFGTPTFESV